MNEPLRTECSSHPDAEDFASFTDGSLTAAEHAKIVEHLIECVDCSWVAHEAATARPHQVC